VSNVEWFNSGACRVTTMGDDARRYTFPRSQRLKRQRLIRSLFDRRRDDVFTVAAGCVRLLWRVVPRAATGYDTPIQVGLAPGRRVRNAVERNRVRRQLREVYRRHQHTLTDLFAGRPTAVVVMILFRGDPARAADAVPRDLPRALRRAAERLRAERAAVEAPASKGRSA
jgi:ribonuclease P protein component